MSDMGGLFRSLTIIAIIIILPISKYVFYLEVIKELFFAKTSDEDLFDQPSE